MPTKLILTSNVRELGSEGDQIEVSDGYARNFLLPKNLAVPASAGALRRIESLKVLRAQRERKELEEAQELAKKIAKLTSSVEIQTGENGKAFGSVTSADIAQALASAGFNIDKKTVTLEEPIKKTGTFEIPIRIHPQVQAIFKLVVTSPNLPNVAAAPAQDAKPKSSRPKASSKSSKKTT